MPIPVTCPGCSAKMKAPDGAAGKKIKCPKCQESITVPVAEEIDDFEVVEDEPAKKPAAKPKVKAVVEADEDDEEDEKPRKKAKAVAEEEDEDDEKPKKKAKAVADDGDDEEKPKKKKKKKKKSEDDDDEEGGVSMTRNIIMGVVLIILIGVAIFVFWNKFGNKDDKTSSTSSNDPDGSAQVVNPKIQGPPRDPIRPVIPNGGGGNPVGNLPGPGGNPGPKTPESTISTADLKLDGAWDVALAEVNGEKVDAAKAGLERVLIYKNKATFYAGGKSVFKDMDVKIYEKTQPKSIDFQKENAVFLPCIYEQLSETEFRLGMPLIPADRKPSDSIPRPTSFNTKDKPVIVLIFRLEKL